MFVRLRRTFLAYLFITKPQATPRRNEAAQSFVAAPLLTAILVHETDEEGDGMDRSLSSRSVLPHHRNRGCRRARDGMQKDGEKRDGTHEEHGMWTSKRYEEEWWNQGTSRIIEGGTSWAQATQCITTSPWHTALVAENAHLAVEPIPGRANKGSNGQKALLAYAHTSSRYRSSARKTSSSKTFPCRPPHRPFSRSILDFPCCVSFPFLPRNSCCSQSQPRMDGSSSCISTFQRGSRAYPAKQSALY